MHRVEGSSGPMYVHPTVLVISFFEDTRPSQSLSGRANFPHIEIIELLHIMTSSQPPWYMSMIS